MLKTLAAKHRSTVTKMARKYKATIATPHGPRTCFEARTERPGRKPLVARFGGIPLKRQRKAVIDRPPARPGHPPAAGSWSPGSCTANANGAAGGPRWKPTRSASSPTSRKPGHGQPAWAALMATMRRKTLIVCAPCHQAIHDGKPAADCT